jgi:hypothetical protein
MGDFVGARPHAARPHVDRTITHQLIYLLERYGVAPFFPRCPLPPNLIDLPLSCS